MRPSLFRTFRLTLVLFFAFVANLWSQAAVVKRNANLREGPATSFAVIRLLLPNDELSLLEPAPSGNYLHVRTADGAEGWVYGPYVRVLDPMPVVPPGPPEVYGDCPLEGNAVQAFRQASNRLKNRVATPAAGDIDAAITLQAMLQPGSDANRWNSARAARITGFVVDVKAGGTETVNCGATSVLQRDTHIELLIDPNSTAKNRRVIVEVTPRWRAFVGEHQGANWSTAALKTQLLNQWVEFTGWMFFDGEHDDEAENTAPGRATNWRATAWEVHPVTALRVVLNPN